VAIEKRRTPDNRANVVRRSSAGENNARVSNEPTLEHDIRFERSFFGKVDDKSARVDRDSSENKLRSEAMLREND